jgi:hypothetical protein
MNIQLFREGGHYSSNTDLFFLFRIYLFNFNIRKRNFDYSNVCSKLSKMAVASLLSSLADSTIRELLHPVLSRVLGGQSIVDVSE